MYSIYPQILNHKIGTLDRGWTKTHGYFIQMGGFMLFDGDNPKGVLSPDTLSELFRAGKIEFPTVTEEEIEDRSKADAFSKTIALGQTLWFVAQCIARSAQHLDLTLVELSTLSLAVLNGLMYYLWWNKSLDVRCPIPVYLLDKPNEPIESSDSSSDSFQLELEPIEPIEKKSNKPSEPSEPIEPNENKPNLNEPIKPSDSSIDSIRLEPIEPIENKSNKPIKPTENTSNKPNEPSEAIEAIMIDSSASDSVENIENKSNDLMVFFEFVDL